MKKTTYPPQGILTDNEIIFGKNSILEFLRNNGNLNKLLILNSIHRDAKIDEILQICQKKRIPYNFVPREKLHSISNTDSHQGIIGYRSPYPYHELEPFLESLSAIKYPILLILDEIQDPHNFGAIIRTAVAANVQGVIISKHRCVPVTPTVVKTSAGLIQNMPVVRVTNIIQTIQTIKKRGYWVYGTSLNTKTDWNSGRYDIPLALIMGSEGKGLSKGVEKHCDELVKIPMPGPAESLNVSISTALMLFKINEKRNSSLPL
ncbi:MAG TPA: 23S rRNA (guanosine(2251)-2'-O)-methyltransferase RlmB [Candidatus Marinimicrobia bacterium]|nr:23S rRNA (guanosine(2251)-2'-O)-methyltransferase RlmB [Candidatus Neomarinimicrobiota bacterium]